MTTFKLALRQRLFPRRDQDRNGSRVLFVLTLIPIILLIGIGAALVIKTIPIINAQSLPELLGGTVWKPMKGLFGYLPFISSTLWVTLLALVLAVPPCILTAIYLSEYASNAVRSFMRPVLDLLAAIPSVVYGVWGMLVIVPWVQNKVIPFAKSFPNGFPLLESKNPTGFSILSGAIVLAVMVAPFIIAVTHEVVINCPRGYQPGFTRDRCHPLPNHLPGDRSCHFTGHSGQRGAGALAGAG